MSKKESTFTVYVRKDGKLTVPHVIRDTLGIEEGDLIECHIRKVRKAK